MRIIMICCLKKVQIANRNSSLSQPYDEAKSIKGSQGDEEHQTKESIDGRSIVKVRVGGGGPRTPQMGKINIK